MNQIKAYHDGCRLKINRMIKLKNPKKIQKSQHWRRMKKKTRNSIYVSLIVNLVLHTYLDYVFCYNYLKKYIYFVILAIFLFWWKYPWHQYRYFLSLKSVSIINFFFLMLFFNKFFSFKYWKIQQNKYLIQNKLILWI